MRSAAGRRPARQLALCSASISAPALLLLWLTPPCFAAQVMADKARDKRLSKRELKIKLNWILRKKSKGF